MSMLKRSEKPKLSPIRATIQAFKSRLRLCSVTHCGLSGRMSEALQMNIEAMERAHEIVKFDRQTLGFDIDVWLTVMRGQTLVMLGRGEEARPFLDHILQLESSQVDALHHVIPSMAYVDLAWAEGNIGMAQEHADRAFSIAMKSWQPLSAGLCPGRSWTIPYRRRKAHFSHRRLVRCPQLRSITKGRSRKRTPYSGRPGKCLQTEWRYRHGPHHR